MKCNKGRLCKNFVISTSVSVSGTTLVVNLPYILCNEGCFVLAQAIPDAATVNMPVVVTVGDDTTQIPLVDRRGIQVSAGRIDTRTSYHFVRILDNTDTVIKICGARCPYNITTI